MPLDFTDEVQFTNWEEFFKLALEGTSASGSPSQAAALVKTADAIAQAAVELVQARAKESRK